MKTSLVMPHSHTILAVMLITLIYWTATGEAVLIVVNTITVSQIADTIIRYDATIVLTMGIRAVCVILVIIRSQATKMVP